MTALFGLRGAFLPRRDASPLCRTRRQARRRPLRSRLRVRGQIAMPRDQRCGGGILSSRGSRSLGRRKSPQHCAQGFIFTLPAKAQEPALSRRFSVSERGRRRSPATRDGLRRCSAERVVDRPGGPGALVKQDPAAALAPRHGAPSWRFVMAPRHGAPSWRAEVLRGQESFQSARGRANRQAGGHVWCIDCFTF